MAIDKGGGRRKYKGFFGKKKPKRKRAPK